MAHRPNGALVREQRRWSFGDCQFDEANWTLTVAGRRVAIEAKPLELLRELLLRPGELVTKDQLLDAIWHDVTVVEASLPTAVMKLRRALGDDRQDHALIETVSGVGYRMAVPVTLETLETQAGPEVGPAKPAAGARARPGPRLAAVAAVAGIAAIGFALAGGAFDRPSGIAPDFTDAQRAQFNAMRRLDLPTIERLIAAGWDPNAPYDREGNNALQWLLGMCEWDPQHDRHRLLLTARTLIDAGADPTYRNGFGDTAYSIAKADRYCGPNHPVTVMLRRLCTTPDPAYGAKCMATYALARGERF